MPAMFLDGPAAGHGLDLRTCPHFLRVVIDADGKVDALDQAGDTPGPGEEIHPYVMTLGTWGVVFVRPGGRYEMGEYRHVHSVGPDMCATFADREAWGAWCREHGNEVALDIGLDPWPGETP